MTKASNFAKSRENRKNHAISDDQILETAPIRYFLTWIWISYYHEITTPISGLLALLAVSTNIIGS